MQGAVHYLIRQLTKADELSIDLSYIDYAYLDIKYTAGFNNSNIRRLFISSVALFPYRHKIGNSIDYKGTDMSLLDFRNSLSNVKYFGVIFELKVFGYKEYLSELYHQLSNLYTDYFSLSDYTEIPEYNPSQIRLQIKSHPIVFIVKNFF